VGRPKFLEDDKRVGVRLDRHVRERIDAVVARRRKSGERFSPSEFLREAIDEKLRREESNGRRAASVGDVKRVHATSEHNLGLSL